MSIAITVLVWALFFVLALVVLVLVSPLRLELFLNKAEAWQFRAALRPFGRFGPRISLSGRNKKPAAPDARPAAKRAKRKSRRLPNRGLARSGARFVADVVRRVRIPTASLQMRFGLGDPADTGEVYGFMAPVIFGALARPGVSLDVEPVFDRAELSGTAELDLSLVPVTLVGPIIRFGWAVFGPQR